SRYLGRSWLLTTRASETRDLHAVNECAVDRPLAPRPLKHRSCSVERLSCGGGSVGCRAQRSSNFIQLLTKDHIKERRVPPMAGHPPCGDLSPDRLSKLPDVVNKFESRHVPHAIEDLLASTERQGGECFDRWGILLEVMQKLT